MFFPVDMWFRAFVLTLAVELPIAGVLLRRYEPAWPRLLVLIVFANLASHPAVWFIFTQWFLVGTPEYVIAAESMWGSARCAGAPRNGTRAVQHSSPRRQRLHSARSERR